MKKSKVFGIRQKVKNETLVLKFLKELQKNIPKNHKDLASRKNDFSTRMKIKNILNRELIVIAQKNNIKLSSKLKNLIQKRSVRTISGVSPIGILTKPYPCPGQCVYCPTEDRMPKSYMSNQPAAARALRNKFHPYDQVKNRIIALQESGHPVSKLEIIVMGGTWSFLPYNYQNWYIREVFRAANTSSTQLKISNINSLKNLQKINETAKHRIIGLTLETRPDFITEKELIRMRKFGCTRIEIGVQTLDDSVSKLTKRGHGRKHVAKAMKLMKDFGFKVCFHLMPGLPGSNIEKDLKWMKEIFQNPDFCPDFVKIYPCVVLETAELKKWWENGEYKPYDDAQLIKLLIQWQTFVPEWTRIMRLMRDIPASSILGGAKFSNLRQIITDQPKKLREIVGDEFYDKHDLDKNNNLFRDIRAREIGFKKDTKNLGKLILKRRDYDASDGKEVFLSFETADEKHLLALLRLRKPSGQKFSQFGSVLHNSALIREVHSYGGEISVGKSEGLGQHRGLGRKLITEAERITNDEWNLPQITIIAGVGTREYYKKFGYKEKYTYMVKSL